MFQVLFEGQTERSAEFTEPVRLLMAGESAGAPLKQQCHGHARCGSCLITIRQGSENLTQPSEPEARVLSILRAGPDQRLACQACASGDVRCSHD